MRKAARFATKMYEKHLASVQLTNPQFSALALLDDRPDITIKEMSATMFMERTSLLRALQLLQRDGLVLASSDAHDSRLMRFALSKAGASRLKQAAPLWLAAQREFEEKIGSRQAEQIRLLAVHVDA